MATDRAEEAARIARETGEEAGAADETVSLAEKMASVAATTERGRAKDINSIAAAALYAASLFRGPKLSQEVIAHADATTAVTIRSHYRWVIGAYAAGAERIPTDVQKRLDTMGVET